MTDMVPASSKKLDKRNDSGAWYEGTHRERIAVRLSSFDTNGAYAIVESIAAPVVPRRCIFIATRISDHRGQQFLVTGEAPA
jgi:hypothetical protein